MAIRLYVCASASFIRTASAFGNKPLQLAFHQTRDEDIGSIMQIALGEQVENITRQNDGEVFVVVLRQNLMLRFQI